jgi:hypothetical protein
VVEPGPQTAAEAAALRAALGRIVRLMLEVIGGRRPAGQLAAMAEAPVRRYLRAARPVAPTGTSGWSRRSPPAWARNGRSDFMAANRLARALYAPVFDIPVLDTPVRPASTARFAFLVDPRARDFWLTRGHRPTWWRIR